MQPGFTGALPWQVPQPHQQHQAVTETAPAHLTPVVHQRVALPARVQRTEQVPAVIGQRRDPRHGHPTDDGQARQPHRDRRNGIGHDRHHRRDVAGVCPADRTRWQHTPTSVASNAAPAFRTRAASLAGTGPVESVIESSLHCGA
jgi:hypothetical protein